MPGDQFYPVNDRGQYRIPELGHMARQLERGRQYIPGGAFLDSSAGTVLVPPARAANGPLTLNVNVFTASGTWTQPANLVFAEVIVLGGGGGGGGAPIGSPGVSAGGGGGAGGYSYGSYLAASLGATETVTVGAGGAGGVNAANGAAGGTSSFGAHASATGGQGGTQGTPTTGGDFVVGTRSLAGQGSGGQINQQGMPSSPGAVLYDGTNYWYWGGNGGSTPYGGGGVAYSGQPASTTGGQGGIGYGAGGAGAVSGASAGGTGGAGSAGVVIVREWTLGD